MEFRQRMKRAREAAGLSLVEAAYAIRADLPRSHWIGYDVIRRLEEGTKPEAKANPIIIQALAKAYGVPVADLSGLADEGIAKIRELVSAQFRCVAAA